MSTAPVLLLNPVQVGSDARDRHQCLVSCCPSPAATSALKMATDSTASESMMHVAFNFEDGATVSHVSSPSPCRKLTRTQFIRTRHNNLRCFPTCSPVHKQNAFCGSPVYVKVKRQEGENVVKQQVFAGFHLENQPEGCDLEHPFDEGETARAIGSSLLSARMYKQDSEFSYFIFMPDGKWTYAATLISSDRHHFTVYYVADGILKECARSPMFHVIPTWKVQPATKSRSASAGMRDTMENEDQDSAEEERRFPQPPPDIKRARIQSHGSYQQLPLQGGIIPVGQNQASSQQSSSDSNQAGRFARPPLVQTHLPYAFNYPRSMPPPSGTPSGVMGPPILYSPSFGHPGAVYSQPSFQQDPNVFVQGIPTPLSSPYNSLSMTISPPAALYPGFSYFPSSSPRYPGIPPEFQTMFSPIGNQSAVRPPPKKQ